MDDFERKVPKQESKDARKLAEGDKGPPPPIGQVQDDHERPGGDLGAVVKVDYEVAPTDADERGKARAVPAGDEPARAPSGKKAPKEPGDPDKLRREIHDLEVRHATGQLKAAEKGRLLDLQAELAEAEKTA